MARTVKGIGRKRRKLPPLDEFGGSADGGLAILDEGGELIHMTPPRVAGALRYFLARVQLHDAQGMPERLALTSALVGEGVTYVTRSLAAAIAYDTEASVVVVDLTFRRPPSGDRKGRRRRARPEAQPAASNGQPDVELEPAGAPGTEGEAEPAVANGADGEPVTESAAVADDDTEASAPVSEDETATEGDDRPRQPTLADAIEHGVDVDDIIIPTANPRLCLIAAGNVPVARRPAIAQGRPLATVLDQLDERFDHVLLDLPPVLVSADAMNLSQLADAYVLVVRQGATSESQVEAALDELQGGETLGVILNRFDSNIPKRLRRLVGT
jgi:Mrp family chromosome partitioning ATPase